MMGKYRISRVKFGGRQFHHSDLKVCDYSSAEELLNAEKAPGIVIMDGPAGTEEDFMKCFASFVTLRRSREFSFAPIYFANSMHELDKHADGVTSDIAGRLAEAEAILDRGARINTERLIDDHNLRLLAYMYTRGEMYRLAPQCVPFSPWGYVYPAAAIFWEKELSHGKGEPQDEAASVYRRFLFDEESAASYKWVKALENNGYLETDELVDRIRLCPKCESSHLNYVDLCSNCGSKNFEKRTMLHCFTCGYVAPEKDFVNAMTLVCPRCGTVLRHLGSDYDHPLESYECNDCGTRFIEPDVKAECFNCHTQTIPDLLPANDLYSYVLSEKGVTAVRTGTMQREINVFDGMNNVVFPYFCSTVSWLSDFRRRYPEEIFTLLCIKFAGVYEVGEALGEEAFANFVKTLSQRMKELIRTTDVITSTAPDTYWILLPRTPLENASIVADRVRALSNLISLPSGQSVVITAQAFEFPEPMTKETVEEQIMKNSESMSRGQEA